MVQDGTPEDEFQKELLGLFATEAYEWLGQILEALVRLEAVPEPSADSEALDAIVRGLTSLGGSAATVDLPGIQESVFGLLPLVEQVRGSDAQSVGELLSSLRSQLGQITASVAESTGIPATVSFDPPTTDLRRAKDFLAALRAMRAAQRVRSPYDRRMVEAVVKRVQKDVERGVPQVDSEGIRQFFTECAQSDEDFLGRIQVAMPAIASAVQALRATLQQPVDLATAAPKWKSLQDTLEQFVELARQRHAVPVMHFFQGLSVLIRLLVERRVGMSPTRWDRVDARIRAVVEMVSAWREAGCVERAAIAQVVPA